LGVAWTTAAGTADPAASLARPERMEALGSRLRFTIRSPLTVTVRAWGEAKPGLDARKVKVPAGTEKEYPPPSGCSLPNARMPSSPSL
jgi:hypothetical protein